MHDYIHVAGEKYIYLLSSIMYEMRARVCTRALAHTESKRIYLSTKPKSAYTSGDGTGGVGDGNSSSSLWPVIWMWQQTGIGVMLN